MTPEDIIWMQECSLFQPREEIQSSCQGEELGPSQFPWGRVYLSTFICFICTERICAQFSSVLVSVFVCVCVCL